MTTSTTLTPQAMLDSLRWRYAVKKFDATRRIPADASAKSSTPRTTSCSRDLSR
jgi:hypothetical protein